MFLITLLEGGEIVREDSAPDGATAHALAADAIRDADGGERAERGAAPSEYHRERAADLVAGALGAPYLGTVRTLGAGRGLYAAYDGGRDAAVTVRADRAAYDAAEHAADRDCSAERCEECERAGRRPAAALAEWTERAAAADRADAERRGEPVPAALARVYFGAENPAAPGAAERAADGATVFNARGSWRDPADGAVIRERAAVCEIVGADAATVSDAAADVARAVFAATAEREILALITAPDGALTRRTFERAAWLADGADGAAEHACDAERALGDA